MDKPNSSVAKLLEKQTPWLSIWTTSGMMMFVGVQMSIYFTSTWQYIKSVHPNATMDLFGWVFASTSLGAAFANPMFGYWNQKTLSTKIPLSMGFLLSAIGNLLYAVLPLLPVSSLSTALVASRFLEGFGAGTLGILRSFLGTASTSKDRVRAVSLGTSGLTTGYALGPVLQICFIPFGSEGIHIGPFVLNTYTTAAYFMFFVSCLGIVLTNLLLVEDYAGIITDEEKKEDPFTVIPLFDRLPVTLLFFYWFMFCGLASTEGMASPITMAMYNWSSEEAVLYNGIIQTVSCLTSTMVYIAIGTTRLGKINSRWHVLCGFIVFLYFYIMHMPWPFYDGPLDRTNGTNAANDGGCSWDYDWCDYTPRCDLNSSTKNPRIPKYLYLFSASIIMGISFPLVAAPCNTMLSEVLGPRKQGLASGLFAFTGSVSQFMFPIITSRVFEMSGYVYIMGWNALMLIFSLTVHIFFWKRLKSLELIPDIGKATKYKSGTFYRM